MRSEFLTLNSSSPQPGPSSCFSGTFSSYSLICTSSQRTYCVASCLFPSAFKVPSLILCPTDAAPKESGFCLPVSTSTF